MAATCALKSSRSSFSSASALQLRLADRRCRCPPAGELAPGDRRDRRPVPCVGDHERPQRPQAPRQVLRSFVSNIAPPRPAGGCPRRCSSLRRAAHTAHSSASASAGETVEADHAGSATAASAAASTSTSISSGRTLAPALATGKPGHVAQVGVDHELPVEPGERAGHAAGAEHQRAFDEQDPPQPRRAARRPAAARRARPGAG